MSNEAMNEKQEADEFDEDEDDDALDEGAEEVDLARLTKDMDLARRRGVKQGVPAWRKLELLAEQRRTAELTSDFDDYKLDDPKPGARRTLRV
jgi:Ni/Co efflux regulator RcnB